MSNVPNKNPNIITAAGAVTPGQDNNFIDASGAIALTVAAPTIDCQEMTFVDQTGHAHTVVCTACLNGGTSQNKLTFGGTIGDSCTIVAQNGFWWTKVLNGVTVS